jgi:pimeloyl-ACP methyl ester carboxylesterase
VRWVLRLLLLLAALVVVANWTWGNLPDEDPPSGRFATVDGVRIHYVERAGTEPAVVLLHGLPGTLHDFDRVARLLPRRRTLALDRPGFGHSDGGYHRLDRQLELLHALLAARGIERPILVGHSYGGTLALAYVDRYPREVRGLVLVDAAAGGEPRSSTFERAQSRLVQALSWPVVQPLADVTFSQALRTASAKLGDAEAFDPDEVNAGHQRMLLASNMRHEDLDAYAGEQLAADEEIERLDLRLGSIDVPAVVIQGREDKLVEPVHGRRIAAALPRARLAMVPGGHMALYTRPGVVATAVRSLTSTASNGSRAG